MTTNTATDTPTTEEELPPTLGDLLLKATTTPREKAAVRALVEEGTVLARDNVRTALAAKTGHGTMGCSWERFGSRLYTLGLTDGERAFADLVLSIAGPHQTGMARVMELDERRLAIILRALVQLSGCDTIAVGQRV